mmetsp:Transcript_27583/g.88698  ORF Transcript_27583/g.88698 Transcript_27583/m.88698 type:complete len:331 (-) Transcript_27583:97-1089(-)
MLQALKASLGSSTLLHSQLVPLDHVLQRIQLHVSELEHIVHQSFHDERLERAHVCPGPQRFIDAVENWLGLSNASVGELDVRVVSASDLRARQGGHGISELISRVLGGIHLLDQFFACAQSGLGGPLQDLDLPFQVRKQPLRVALDLRVLHCLSPPTLPLAHLRVVHRTLLHLFPLTVVIHREKVLDELVAAQVWVDDHRVDEQAQQTHAVVEKVVLLHALAATHGEDDASLLGQRWHDDTHEAGHELLAQELKVAVAPLHGEVVRFCPHNVLHVRLPPVAHALGRCNFDRDRLRQHGCLPCLQRLGEEWGGRASTRRSPLAVLPLTNGR